MQPGEIYEMSSDAEQYKKNMKIVFEGFLEFLSNLEKEKKINWKDWILKTDKQGADTIDVILTWVLKFQRYEEEFLYFDKKKINSTFLSIFSEFIILAKIKKKLFEVI